MITHEITTTFSEQYLLSRKISPESCAFFDIETTGFKASTSHLYLIGAAFRCADRTETIEPGSPTDNDTSSSLTKTHTWLVRQWMAEEPREETELLKSFAELLKNFHTLLHFNGNHFDIPYLEEKYRQYQLSSPFTDLTSIDLYQDFRCLKSFLKLEHMNQKSLEVFLGLERDDRYDGGKLISVYRDFCKTGCPEKQRLLLLHNQEDVSGMLTLTGLYAYVNFLDMDQFPHLSIEILQNKDGTKDILFSFPLKAPVPVPVSLALEYGYLTLNKTTGKLMLPLLEDTLYYFFPDYKNYYYLPQEDQAIHKSIATYVDKQYRRPAKKENCYTKQAGTFLPQTEELFHPAFRRTYNDSVSWFLWKEEEWTDTEKWNAYLTSLLRGSI